MSLLYFMPTAGELSVTKRGNTDDVTDAARDRIKVLPLLRPLYFGRSQEATLRRTEAFGNCRSSTLDFDAYEIYIGRAGVGEITHRKATNRAYKHSANRLAQLQSLVRAQAKRELKAWKQERSRAFDAIRSQARQMPKYKRWTEMKVRYDPDWTNKTAWTTHPVTGAWTAIIPPHAEARKVFSVDRMIYDPRFVGGHHGYVKRSKPRNNETPIVSQLGGVLPALYVGAYQYRIRLRKLNAKQAAKARKSGKHYPKIWVREQELAWLRDHPQQESQQLQDLRKAVYTAQLKLDDARASQECVQWTYEYSPEYAHEVDRAIVGNMTTSWDLYGPALRDRIAQTVGKTYYAVREAQGSISPSVLVPIHYVVGRAVSESGRSVQFNIYSDPELHGFAPGYSDRGAQSVAVTPRWERFEGKTIPVTVDRFVDAPDQSTANAVMHRKYFQLADYVVRATVDDVIADRATGEMKDLPDTFRSMSEFIQWCRGVNGRMTLRKACSYYLGWKFGVEPLQRDVAAMLAQVRRGMSTWRRAFIQLYKGVYSLVQSPSTVKSFFTLGKTPKESVYVLDEKPASYVSLMVPVFSDSPLAGWQGDIRRDSGWVSWYSPAGEALTGFIKPNGAFFPTDRVPDTRDYYARYLAGKVVQLSPEHVRWALETLLMNGSADLWRGLVHKRPGSLCCTYFREEPSWFLKGCLTREDRTAWDRILQWSADINLFQVGWELTNLSFVLDWFLNTHDLAVIVNNMNRAAADGSRLERAPKEIWGHDRVDWSGFLQMPQDVRVDVRFRDASYFPLTCFPGWGSTWEKECRVAGMELADINRWRMGLGFDPLDLPKGETWRLDNESLYMSQVPCHAMEIRLYVPHKQRAFPRPPRIASRFRRGRLGLNSPMVWDALKPRVQINLDWGKLITLAALVLSR